MSTLLHTPQMLAYGTPPIFPRLTFGRIGPAGPMPVEKPAITGH